MNAKLRWTPTAAIVALAAAATVHAEPIRGVYCQVCGAAAQSAGGENKGALGGHAILGWRVKTGSHRGVRLDGLAAVAVVSTRGPNESDTAVLIDKRATPAQQESLVHFIREFAPQHLGQITSVTPVEIDLRIGEGCAKGHVVLKAGVVMARTRSIRDSDPPEFRSDEPALGNVFYSYNAITEEYSCAIPDAQGKLAFVSGAHLPTALVGGF